MIDVSEFLATNLPLFCASFVVLFLAIKNIKIKKRESILFIIFISIVLFLSVVVTFEKDEALLGNVVLATMFTSFGYILRPVLLYVFCIIANMETKRIKLFYIIWAAPLFANLIIYLFPLFFNVPTLSTIVFSYQLNSEGVAIFTRGGFLNFFSHIVSGAYLLLLIYVSFLRFYGKHRRDAFVLLLVVAFILATVLTEVITGRNDLLNMVCAICALTNYIFITSVNTSKDVLTGLYDRRTFYIDSKKYRNSINGVIQIDMNGLKFINDEEGHLAGDTALKQVGNIFDTCIDKGTMIAYRLSGDEFVILMIQGKKEHLEKTASDIVEATKKTKYSIAIGTYFIEKEEPVSFEEAMKKAEELMYQDKDKFYQENNVKRRKK